MSEQRIPDPVLMARLQLSVKGVDWAASRVKPWQHEPFEGGWSAHQVLVHLIRNETRNFHVRIAQLLAEDNPVFPRTVAPADDDDREDIDIETLAEEFMAARQKTFDTLKELTPEQWRRTGTWTDGRVVDMAWIAEKVLWHALEHFAALLDMHQHFDPIQAK